MYYDIAGMRILIKNKYDYTNKFCCKYLSPDQQSEPDLEVSISQEDIEKEKEVSKGFSDGYIENICIYRNLCVQLPVNNRFLLHSAILRYDNQGFAFAGHSGAGKSTHTSLWMKYLEGCDIVNGDKPIVEYKNGDFIAYGTPWMGKEGRGCNSSVKIKGICFIEKAKENSIVKLTPEQTASRIFTQILIPSDEENASKTLELCDKFVTEIPAYVLYCDISEEAVKVSFEALTGKKYKNQ